MSVAVPLAARSVSSEPKKIRLAVWKFASCDGCQLSLLDCEDDLLAVAEAVEIAYFPEATRTQAPGPYDVSLVEGSITTAEDVERIKQVRAQSRVLITIGACATAGGIQALRNFADVKDYTAIVYPRPEFIHTLEHSTPIAAHVKVDAELRGCPVNKRHLVELLVALLNHRRPNVPHYSVCLECKRRGNVCVMVARGMPCLGPATQAGCGAICPSFHRGCYGCFGPMEQPNPKGLTAGLQAVGTAPPEILRAWQTFNTWSEPFRAETLRLAEALTSEPITTADQRERTRRLREQAQRIMTERVNESTRD